MVRDGSTQELRIFVEVVRQRSFARAAVALGLGPSAVSQAITRFEARLGRKLLERTTRHVRPTALGERVAGDAAIALGQLDDVYRLVEASSSEAAGSLLLSVPRVGMEMVIAPALPTFVARYPAIALDIRVEDSLIDIASGHFDAGLRRGDLIDEAMVARRVSGDEQGILVASPTYLRDRGMPACPRDLRNHACIRIRRPRAGTLLRWRFENDQDRATVTTSRPLEVSDAAVARALCLAGLGVSYFAYGYVADHLRSGALRRVLADWSTPLFGFYLYYRSGPSLPPALAAFRDMLVDRLPGAASGA